MRQLGILAGKEGRIFKAYHHSKDNDCSSIPSMFPHPIGHLFFKTARSPGKAHHIVGAQRGFAMWVSDCMETNKMCVVILIVDTDTAPQCFNYLPKDVYGWPGSRTRSLNVGPGLFPSYQRFSKWRALHNWDPRWF